jgi:16S rRNA (cytosine967-C5)-methyltransferase
MKNLSTNRDWSSLVGTILAFEHDSSSLRLGREHLPPGQYHLLASVVRHATLLRHCIRLCCARPPKAKLHALLMAAVADLLPEEGAREVCDVPVKVHHAVEQARRLCSERESGFVNAVLRKIAGGLQGTLETLEAEGDLATRYSHPQWLIDRWMTQHGSEATLRILRWNQGIPVIHAHDAFGFFNGKADAPTPESMGLGPSSHQDFYQLTHGGARDIEALMQHPLYIQDPSTAIAPGLISGDGISNILDACSAPGGKLLHLRKQLGSGVRLWATDLSKKRLHLVQENCQRLSIETAGIACLDWSRPDAACPEGWPDGFDAVLLDAPCSSIGIIQKHPEIRWRLSPADYETMPALQLSLLRNVARKVRAGGQLAFSTCSFDTGENRAVIDAFLAAAEGEGFSLVAERIWFPGTDGMDGGTAILLRAPATRP